MSYIQTKLWTGLAVTFLGVTMFCTSAFAGGFFERANQYKGFYWFDDLRNEASKKEAAYQMPSAEQATQEIEQRKQRLDDTRNQMIAVGLDKNAPASALRDSIIAYKKLELGMWNSALRLSDSSDMANFTNPELSDNLQQPTNVFGVKLKRKLDEQQVNLTIMEFAKDFDLVLFSSASCPYCKSYTPVVKHFVAEHKFQLDITTLDGKAGRLAVALGINAVPTLVAIKKDGTQMMEITRGMYSGSGLANQIKLASALSKESTHKKKKSRRIIAHKKSIEQYKKNILKTVKRAK